MPQISEFRLPDVGEGLTEAEVLAWHVQVGDTVEVNDVLVEVETAKSVVELPSPVDGVVTKIGVEVGTTVPVGTVLVVITSTDSSGSGDDAAGAREEISADAAQGPAADAEAPAGEQEAPLILVGTGPSAPSERRRRLSPRSDQRAGASAGPSQLPGAASGTETRIRVTPLVRKMAAVAGVDLPALAAQTNGRVTREQVVAAAERARSAASAASPPARETRTPVKGVRKATAAAMVRSAFTAPHVTEWLTVDVTPTMELIARLKADRAWSGVRVNPLLMVARAFLLAIRQFPAINARWDEDAQEIVQYGYVHLGIAAATARGLIVPNIKDAHEMDLAGLARAMSELVETARAGKTSPDQMSKGTITITNIGALGVDAGTPILNPGESAILALGAIRPMPWVVDGGVQIRQVTQLAMSFDHRLVDGELGSNVLAATGALLADPGRAITHV